MWTYNRLIALRNQAQNAWKQIDVQLKRRHDLIPNLVAAVKGAREFERDTLERVMAARSRAVAAVAESIAAEGELSRALRQLFAVVENYPTLRANETVLNLQEELTTTENQLGFARQFYDDAVMRSNTQQEVFPASVIASSFGFRRAESRRSLYFARQRQTRAHPLLLVLAVALVLVSPLLSRLLAMAVSRRREYQADATAVELTRNPEGLARALAKISGSPFPLRSATRGTAHLFIVSPLRRRADERHGTWASLLATHPPLAHRIALLRGMAT